MRDKNGRYLPGESGNPHGRPKGSKHELSEAFLNDLTSHWRVHGLDAIERACLTKPESYVRLVAGLIPKEVGLEVTEQVGSFEIKFV